MTWLHWLALICTACLAVYLLAALLVPEKIT
jgi:K+-transporting ATPase KdpF subunit